TNKDKKALFNTRRIGHLNSKPPLPPVLRSGLYQPDRGFIPINLRTRCARSALEPDR
ncbi:unnamed protein product, partial [Sphenostylis stenocarpa]